MSFEVLPDLNCALNGFQSQTTSLGNPGSRGQQFSDQSVKREVPTPQAGWSIRQRKSYSSLKSLLLIPTEGLHSQLDSGSVSLTRDPTQREKS